MVFVACVTTGDDTSGGAGGKGDQIDPTDDEDLATLLVRLPPNLPGTPAIEPFEIRVSSPMAPDVIVPVDTPVRFLAGERRLAIIPSVASGGVFDTTITLVAGQTTTIDLAAILFRWDATSPSSPFNIAVGHPAQVDLQRGDGEWIPLPHPVTTYRALLPGTYAAKRDHPALQPVPVTATGGVVQELDVTPPDTRATIVVHPPQRAFPTPDLPCRSVGSFVLREITYASHEPYDLESAIPDVGSPLAIRLDANQTTTSKLLPYPSTHDTHHELIVSNIATPLAPTPGQTLDIFVKRIDVNDVRITRENGTTYTVPGSWNVERYVGPGPTGWVPMMRGAYCPSPFRTRTGIDVLPGKYRVTIEYSTGEGPARQEHILNL